MPSGRYDRDEGGGPMSHSTTQFITQMKLRELRRQRAKLREAYETLRAEVAGAGDPGTRLRRLYDGLRGLAFAGQPLHPDVVNLEVLLHEADAGTAAPEVLDLWLGRLEEELGAGRARSEVVYLFGALLEEWARGEAAGDRQADEARRARDRLRGEALAPDDAGPDDRRAVLGPLIEELGPARAELAGRLERACREDVGKPVSAAELGHVLRRIAGDIYRTADLRREARRFAEGDELRKELADALTILLAELPSWDWPAEGLEARATWTRNKWRLYLAEDLPTACLLEVLGERWVGVFERLVGDRTLKVGQRRGRLRKLTELRSPEVVLANERRMLRLAEQLVDLGAPEEADPWAEDAAGPAPAPDGGSVASIRATFQETRRGLRGAGGDYEGDYGGTNDAIMLVHAEVQLARAAFPDRPLYVVKVDLRDYYPSIPHDVVLGLLRALGMPEDHLGVFARFLAPPLRSGAAGPERMRRGVPMGHTLSGMLAELVLRLLERHVLRRARVRIVRVVDDLAVLTPDPDAAVAAWEAVESFCAASGLRIHPETSGARGLGGERPARLPAGRPRWGMLELDEQGRWHVHRATFEAHLEQSVARVEAAPSVLSKVQAYNANLKYLLNALALGCRLGDAHRESAGRAVVRYHHAFFGPGRGIAAGLRAAIGARLHADPGADPEVAEGWLYWPITAGGLGLRDPMVVVAQYAAGGRDLPAAPAPDARPADWDVRDNDWGAFYAQFLEAIAPLEPEETKVMKTLLDDFIARGAEVSAGRQRGLASYWRWILCTYGPQVLRRFGTFRFLITELVPLQLITLQLVLDSSLDGGRPSAGARE
jgi:hypothetical protein